MTLGMIVMFIVMLVSGILSILLSKNQPTFSQMMVALLEANWYFPQETLEEIELLDEDDAPNLQLN